MSQKAVLITGCSLGGIGHSLALEWHQKGARVFATARRLEAMSSLSSAGIETLAMDVTSLESLKTAKEEVEKRSGGTLDVLVNNAGQGYSMPILDIDFEIAKEMYEVNVWGVIRTTQVFSDMVIAAEGTIVIIGSIAGVMPYVFGGAYNSSKAAINSIADTLRIEMFPFNVNVLNICTGGVKTNLSPNSITRWDLKLPSTSVYMPIEQFFKKRQGYSNANAIPAEEYARQVVRSVDGARGSGWIWRGYFARMCWFLSTFGWRGIFDLFFRRAFGLDVLRNIVRERKKQQ